MERLSIFIVAASDVEAEKQALLRLIATLNTQYQDTLELRPILVDSLAPEQADLSLALVWSVADEAFRSGVASIDTTGEKWLLQKTSLVPLDLSDANLLARRVRQKQELDTLVAGADGWTKLTFDRSLSEVLEPALKRFINRRLGRSMDTVSLRPQLGDTYLFRERLLQRLPDTGPHVVLLEAPYGYGKSVLAAQWAAQLETEAWRVIWLAAEPTGFELGARLATTLDLAADTPPALLRECLWQQASLVVIEDLQGDEDLSLILEELKGLLLLASRTRLEDERLDALSVAGQLSRFGAEELAFTLEEAQGLTADRALGETLHASTLGWSLPLHVASLTGSAPDGASLLAGIRASVTDEAWSELLFLAALPYLPRDAVTNDSEVLVTKGFVQQLEMGLRLHPFIADLVLQTELVTVANIVRQKVPRLPLLLQGEAFESCQDRAGLVAVLEAIDAELWRHAPAALVRWDSQLAAEASWRRHMAVGAAQARLNKFASATERLETALTLPGLVPNEQLNIMRHLCLPLAVHDNVRGQDLIQQAEPLLAGADPELAGLFLSNASIIYAQAGDHDAALAVTERALTYYPADTEQRLGAEINLCLHRFHHYGDVDGRLRVQRDTLAKAEVVYPVQAVGQCRDLAFLHWWQGDYVEARRYFERATEGENNNAAVALESRAALAYLDGDSRLLDEFAATAQLFSNSYLNDIIAMYRLFDRLADDSVQAAYIFEQSPKGVFASAAYARLLAQQGDRDAALAVLAAHDNEAERTRQLYLAAARYVVTRNEEQLQIFLSLTLAGARLLPGFIPLDTLPDEPELSRHYPVEDVLRSAWKEAIALREDIPALELRLLAEVSVELLEQPLVLTDRQKQILTLLTLGLNRDQVAEAMWPEVGTKKQRNNLNVQLNTLRKVIEPWGVATYLFEDGLRRADTDYQRLQTALANEDAAEVAKLYREPFAPGLDLPVISAERERVREDVVFLLYTASASTEDKAPEYLRRVLELEPLHEEALQALLKELIRRGRRREARQRYQAFAELLAREMELEPLAETQALLA